MCPQPPPRRRPHCLTHHERAEWLALTRLRYLTNLTNSRVRSTHPFHTKSPFSRFLGGRRQKSENIVVSARGRRRPQAPTLRISGCANARKYDYKSGSLYSQSNGVPRMAGLLKHRTALRPPPGARWPVNLRVLIGRPGPLGFGLCGRLPRNGVGGFMFNSSSSSFSGRLHGRWRAALAKGTAWAGFWCFSAIHHHRLIAQFTIII